MAPSEDRIWEALKRVTYPGFSRDIVAAGVVRAVRLDGDRARVDLAFGPASPDVASRIEREVRQALATLEGLGAVEIEVEGRAGAAGSPALKVLGARPAASASGALDPGLIPQVRQTVAVASGKGGVGKSTVAVNLAVALARRGVTVGLLDADIYGPSVPLMMGLAGAQPRFLAQERRLVPFERFGVRFMSLGFLVEPDAAVIWRGPMVMKAIEQLLRDVDWGALDLLVVDMPPGTGDAQLTLSQRVQLAGSVIVTTPQDVALADAIKGVAMFRKVGVRVLGLVENMSYFVCPHCSGRSEIFGHGGGRAQAERLGVPFLGEIPLDPAIRSSGDAGEPVASLAAETPQAAAFLALADGVLGALGGTPAEEPPGAGLFERFRKVWGRPNG